MTPGGGVPDAPDTPATRDVLDALDRVTASAELRSATQLAAFLGFVVQAAQRGDASRIKAYTIAVEALGRPADFDPDADSIVRVVAGRLRRALDTYYAGEGAADPLVIELPRGGYVPRFRHRTIAAPVEQAPPPPTDPPARQAAGATVTAAAGTGFAARHWRKLVAVVACIAVAVAIAAGGIRVPRDGPAAPGRTIAAPAIARRPAPLVYFQPFDSVGTPPGSGFTAERMLGKLGDALVRFDGINVMTEREPAPGEAGQTGWSVYRLGGSAEYHPDGTTTLHFRLVDAADGTLYWSRSFDRVRLAGDGGHTEDAIVREVATAIAAPFGAVWARELNVHGSPADPRRACVIAMIEYWRKFNPALHERVRQCALRMTEDDPSDFSGSIGTALVDLRDYFLDIVRPGEPPALDRALQAALQAVKVKPDSARAYEVLFVIWFTRGDLSQAWITAERAMALNPYDSNIAAEYGTRLIMAGQTEHGRRLLRASADQADVRPASFDFAVFLDAYLSGDRASALQTAAVIENDRSPFGLLARALAGNLTGDTGRARQAVQELARLSPAWGSDPRRQLSKFFPNPEVRDRLLRDLEVAGLRPARLDPQ